MKHKKYIFLFILTISISLFVIGCIYNIVSGKPLKINLAYQFIINLPLCIALGFIDFGVINWVYKRLKSTSNVVRISIDLLLTTFLSVSLAGILNCLLAGPEMSGWDIFKNSLPVIPWNWIAVFQIEIFFYNLQQTEMEKRLAVIEKESCLPSSSLASILPSGDFTATSAEYPTPAAANAAHNMYNIPCFIHVYFVENSRALQLCSILFFI